MELIFIICQFGGVIFIGAVIVMIASWFGGNNKPSQSVTLGDRHMCDREYDERKMYGEDE